MNANNLLKKISKSKQENKVKLSIKIDVVDLGDGKEDLIVYGPFGDGTPETKLMCVNIINAAAMKVCQYQKPQLKVQLPNAADIAEVNKSKMQ